MVKEEALFEYLEVESIPIVRSKTLKAKKQCKTSGEKASSRATRRLLGKLKEKYGSQAESQGGVVPKKTRVPFAKPGEQWGNVRSRPW